MSKTGFSSYQDIHMFFHGLENSKRDEIIMQFTDSEHLLLHPRILRYVTYLVQVNACGTTKSRKITRIMSHLSYRNKTTWVRCENNVSTFNIKSTFFLTNCKKSYQRKKGCGGRGVHLHFPLEDDSAGEMLLKDLLLAMPCSQETPSPDP